MDYSIVGLIALALSPFLLLLLLTHLPLNPIEDEPTPEPSPLPTVITITRYRKRKPALHPIGPIPCPFCLKQTINGNYCDQCGNPLRRTRQPRASASLHSNVPPEMLKYPAYTLIHDYCSKRNLPIPKIVFRNPEHVPLGPFGADRAKGVVGMYDPSNYTIYLLDPYEEGVALHELMHFLGHIQKGNPAHYVYP